MTRVLWRGLARFSGGILAALMLLSFRPAPAAACDPACGTFGAVVVGIPAAVVTTLIAPAVGAGLSDAPAYPYGHAVLLTALASGAGVVMGATVSSDYDANLTALIAFPVLMGVATTALVSHHHGLRARGREALGRGPDVLLGWVPSPGGGRLVIQRRF